MSFPVSPINNELAVVNGITYIYNSSNNTWKRVPVVVNTSDPLAGSTANAAFAEANAAFLQANSAYQAANNVAPQVQPAFDTANSASLYANGAFLMANAAYAAANNVTPQVQPAFNTANSASLYANGAFIQANSAYDKANSANVLAQQAYDAANTKYSKTGGEITGDVKITGNLIVTGTQITEDSRTTTINDNMLYLNSPLSANVTNAVGNGTYVVYTTDAAHYFNTGETVSVSGVTPSSFNITSTSNTAITDVTSNTFTVASSVTDSYVSGGVARMRVAANPDIGFAAGYSDGTYHHTGLFRDATDGTYKFFYNYTPEPDESLYIDINDASFRIANLTANIITDVISVRGLDPLTQANGAFIQANAAFARANLASILTFGSAPPVSGNVAGDRWIDSSDGTEYTYINDGSSLQWVDFTTPTINAYSLSGGSIGTIPYQVAAGNTAYIPLGSSGQFLTLSGTTPTWSSLPTTGVTAGTYGGSTNIPVVVVDSTGRISSAANVALSIPAGTSIYANTNQLTANSATGNVLIGLATTAVTPGAYIAPSITVDSYGRLTAAAAPTGSSVQFGSFGVGVAASGTSGEIRATNDITAFYTSDIKFKENVKDIENPLSIVNAIGGKTYDWTDEHIKNRGGEDGYFIRKQDFGVIAQDVESVFPLAVRTKPDGTLAVDYEKLCAVAFAAIKEQQKQIDELKGMLNGR